jgi:hypothetical protein
MKPRLEVIPMGLSDGWPMEVQQRFAVDIYKQMWRGCRVHETDARTSEEDTARLLDFGDVDKIIIHEDSRQVHMAQRFRKPYGSDRIDPDFTLRYSRPCSDEVIEYERLMTAHASGDASYPSRYAFGRVHSDYTYGIYELYIIDTDRFIDGIKQGHIRERGPKKVVKEGQEFMWYDVDDIRAYGAVCKHWESDPDDGDDRGTRQSGLFQFRNDGGNR